MSEHDFYTAGSHQQQAGAYMSCTLTKSAPADGIVSSIGVAVAPSLKSKKANVLGWSSVLRAVEWAAERSPAFLADLQRIAERFATAEVVAAVPPLPDDFEIVASKWGMTELREVGGRPRAAANHKIVMVYGEQGIPWSISREALEHLLHVTREA